MIPSTVDAVFNAILTDIVSGAYAPGARLPAERDLARSVGASRPTVREALRRLAEWRLVEARRGSGIAVREMRDWSIEVLPAYMRHVCFGGDRPGAALIAADMLALRRSLILAIVARVASRIPRGGLAAARRALRVAHEARQRPEFVARDLDVIRAVVEAAKFLPAVWMLNRVASVYLDIASSLSGAMSPPDDYARSYEALLDALEARDGERAVAAIGGYLERHDRGMLAQLGEAA